VTAKQRVDQPELGSTDQPRPSDGQRPEPFLFDIVENSTAVIYVKDLEGRYLFVNRHWEQLFEVPRADVVGATDFELFPLEAAEAFRQNDRIVAERGEVMQFQEEAPDTEGFHSYVSVKFPLRDPNGRMYAIAGISTDITEQVRAEQAHARLSHRLQLILDSVGEGVYGVDRHGRATFINAAGAAMIGCRPEDVVGRPQHEVLRPHRADGTPYAADACPVYAVLRDGQPRRVQGEYFQRLDGTAIPVEYIGTPIRDGEAVVGAVVAFRDLTDQLRQRHVESELQAAEAVQQRLYPAAPPSIEGLEIAGASYPAEVTCGDYFDFIPLPDGSLVVAVGDVSGHGLAPALHMVETRAYLRALLLGGVSLGECLQRLNGLLASDMAEGSFVSLFLARFTPGGRSLTYASAGHEARVLRADGRAERLVNTGLVLALIPTIEPPQEVAVPLSPGDVLLLPTDGLAETISRDDQLFGWERIVEIAAAHRDDAPRELIDRLYRAGREFADGLPRRDDVTMVVARVRSPEAPR
jgi:PAS domain S-box-containing protein